MCLNQNANRLNDNLPIYKKRYRIQSRTRKKQLEFESMSKIFNSTPRLLLAMNIPLAIFLLEYTYQLTYVRGNSMWPTLNVAPGEVTPLIINKWPSFKFKPAENLKIDDLLYVRSPLNPNKFVIKRVKGLQGDTMRTKDNKEDVKVPKNHVWVEGDNINNSLDSNKFGPISIGLIVGKVAKRVDGKYPFFHDIQLGGREARVSLIDKVKE